MNKDFRSYNLAVKLYQEAKKIKASYYVKDQLLRASFSVCLNLSEGNGRRTVKDKRKFYNIAFASLREVQSIIHIENFNQLIQYADILGAYLYKLERNVYIKK